MDFNTLWLPTATAFGLALLHSLWIGAIIYALVRTCLPLLPSAGARHNLAYGGLLLLAVGFMTAFYRNFDYTPVCEDVAGASISLVDLGINLAAAPAEKSSIEVVSELLPNFAPWLSLIYLFGLIPAALYLLRDQRRVQFLRSAGLTELPTAWSATVAEELQQHPATKKVTTYLSRYAGEVMTLGFWSPVIVFPIALANALSPEMARTILLHEIAHLRHYDHWLNYPQQFLRTLFFYHPAAHGLCRIIDREREHRCDDWVAARCQDRRTYATALVTVARTSINPTNTLVMSATKTPFSSRIQRLFQGEEQRGGHAVFSLMFISLLAIGHLSFSTMGADAGAVDCFEEQEKDSAVETPVTTAVVIEQSTPAITLTASPAAAPIADEPTEAAPAATINFIADEDYFMGTVVIEATSTIPAITPLPRRMVNTVSPLDTVPPAAKGAPAKQNIRIRDSGDKQPLFILDGTPLDGSLDDYELDPSNIKSISVFKGASAIEKFGPSGANGVVDITTKNGKKVNLKSKIIIETPEATPEHKVVIGVRSEPAKGATPSVIVEGQLVDDETAAKKALIIVDGERVTGDLNTAVSPEDIESVSVLKGNAATSLYGDDGKNGVVLVTTKKGKKEGAQAPSPAVTIKKGRLKKALPASVIIESVSDAISFENEEEKVSARVKYKAGSLRIDVDEEQEAAPAVAEEVVIETPEVTVPAMTLPGKVQTTFTGANNPVKAYPNPTTGVVNFSNVPETEKQLTIGVYTPFGELVRQEKFNGTNIDIQGLATGQYLIVLTDGQQQWINNVTVTK